MAKDPTGTTDAPKPKKSKKKLLIIVLIAVVFLGGGGTGGYLMFGPGKATAEPAPEKGIVVPLEAITINLADGHYLKLKLSLQATLDVAEAPDGSEALDIAIELYSNRKMAELMSNEARDKSKTELKDHIVKAYTVHKVKEIMDVYFTTFVIQ